MTCGKEAVGKGAQTRLALAYGLIMIGGHGKHGHYSSIFRIDPRVSVAND
jgi:hypothetical protein